jgi:multimeric flavodoxin WrbA
MKVFVLNGLSIGHMEVYEMIADELEKMGWQVIGFDLRGKKIAPCLGCFGCWVKTPGICVIDDDGREVARLAAESDLLVFLTSITFGGYSSHLKKAVDRMIPIVSPFFLKKEGEIHHKPRYARYPHLRIVGVLSRPDEESERIFRSHIARNARNFHGPSIAAKVIFQGEALEEKREVIKGFFK